MAREITFKIKKKEYKITPIKVDRKKLYGYTEILAVDENGDESTLASTDDMGKYIIPKSGTGIGILDTNGKWVDRAELEAFDEKGKPASLITSSYNTIIELKDKTTAEEFLNHAITAFYQCENVPEELLKAIGKDIYIFDYTYLDSYDTNPAFLMVTDNNLFMLTGIKNKFDIVCFGDCGNMDNEDY